MRRNTFPPRPRPDGGRLRAPERTPEQSKRKVFNCIVDDTALVAGAKKSTRDGIRKWISQDAIRLFVPLHTLDQLRHLQNGDERINLDSRDALKWLDDITSMPTIDDRVQLEGVDEAYDTWEEVEQFLLPETLLSMEESDSEDDDDYVEDMESSFNALDVSDETSVSSTHSLEHPSKSPRVESVHPTHQNRPINGNQTKIAAVAKSPISHSASSTIERSRGPKSPKKSIPPHLRPFFNHIMWRINKESNPGAALESFILLTNDPSKQMIAQKFGIRAKRLEQLRDAVAREDREYKNHLAVDKIESEARRNNLNVEPKGPERPKSSHSNVSKSVSAVDSDDDDDEVILKRAPRGPAQQNNNQRVFDPNDFGRTNQQASPRGNRGAYPPSRGRGSPRGGPSPRGGRGAFSPRGAYVPPGPSFRPTPTNARHDPNRPIDPDSFARPPARGSAVRGARRSLWEPN
ncbi:unnamed protein product [Periconia digitata]|uniref:PIN domain-containing protein n=1 Tax=Periconia digitata TaxID=1303443 RepID=A0A9W4ULB3_9PLEO|nr:unnamed protein product [Periconia digitata]